MAESECTTEPSPSNESPYLPKIVTYRRALPYVSRSATSPDRLFHVHLVLNLVAKRATPLLAVVVIDAPNALDFHTFFHNASSFLNDSFFQKLRPSLQGFPHMSLVL